MAVLNRPPVLDRLKALCPTISVGTLTADLMDMGAELARLERAGVGLVHVDVMDGCFCPMLTVGPPYVKGLRTPLLKDVHLMVREPLDSLAEYVAAGADIVTVHVESAVHIHRVLQHLGGMKTVNDPESKVVRGLALNPATSLAWLTEPLLAEIDVITLLGIDPGWSGQAMAPDTLCRLVRVKEIVAGFGRDILTCVDGGITRGNIAGVAAAGPDLMVTGSAVFDGKDAERNAMEILAEIRAAAPNAAPARAAGTPAQGAPVSAAENRGTV
jgi:ribulose-phosphate 3-epimerase